MSFVIKTVKRTVRNVIVCLLAIGIITTAVKFFYLNHDIKNNRAENYMEIERNEVRMVSGLYMLRKDTSVTEKNKEASINNEKIKPVTKEHGKYVVTIETDAKSKRNTHTLGLSIQTTGPTPKDSEIFEDGITVFYIILVVLSIIITVLVERKE